MPLGEFLESDEVFRRSASGEKPTSLGRCRRCFRGRARFHTDIFAGGGALVLPGFKNRALRTIGQLLAGVAIERPSGNVAVDETFKKAPKAKAKGQEQTEIF